MPYPVAELCVKTLSLLTVRKRDSTQTDNLNLRKIIKQDEIVPAEIRCWETMGQWLVYLISHSWKPPEQGRTTVSAILE